MPDATSLSNLIGPMFLTQFYFHQNAKYTSFFVPCNLHTFCCCHAVPIGVSQKLFKHRTDLFGDQCTGKLRSFLKFSLFGKFCFSWIFLMMLFRWVKKASYRSSDSIKCQQLALDQSVRSVLKFFLVLYMLKWIPMARIGRRHFEFLFHDEGSQPKIILKLVLRHLVFIFSLKIRESVHFSICNRFCIWTWKTLRTWLWLQVLGFFLFFCRCEFKCQFLSQVRKFWHKITMVDFRLNSQNWKHQIRERGFFLFFAFISICNVLKNFQ